MSLLMVFADGCSAGVLGFSGTCGIAASCGLGVEHPKSEHAQVSNSTNCHFSSLEAGDRSGRSPRFAPQLRYRQPETLIPRGSLSASGETARPTPPQDTPFQSAARKTRALSP